MVGISAAFAAALAVSATAQIVPVAPAPGETFQTLTDAQLKVYAGATRQERFDILKANADAFATNDWRRQRPLVFKWKTTATEGGVWRLRLSQSPDFADGEDLWLEKESVTSEPCGKGKSKVWTAVVPRANLELGKTYYWQVWSDVKCRNWSCGFTYPDKCQCGRTKAGSVSDVFSFKTADTPPRWIAVEGRVENIRDLGGWRTADGGRVRTGLVYRGQGLNDNSVAGIRNGRNRLMVEDVAYLAGTLGIKTDLDLRGPREVAALAASPLGAGVRFVNVSSECYKGIFTDNGRKAMAECFRLFCDRANYPVYFHCIAGADRTGSLAYVLNGLLGVAKEDLERDWEATFYPRLTGVENPDYWRSACHFDRGFAKYGKDGDTLQERIRLYLLDCGITEEEIAAFRGIMAEPAGN